MESRLYRVMNPTPADKVPTNSDMDEEVDTWH